MSAFNAFQSQYSALANQMVETVYDAAHALKGTGSGTSAGFWMSKVNQYLQITTVGFDLYNNCSLNYYLAGLGSNL
jgi:hypothetical protein